MMRTYEGICDAARGDECLPEQSEGPNPKNG
jgi:hypothetical protein